MGRPEEKKAKKKLPMVKNLRSKEVSYSNLSALLHCSMITHCNPQIFRKSVIHKTSDKNCLEKQRMRPFAYAGAKRSREKLKIMGGPNRYIAGLTRIITPQRCLCPNPRNP